MSPGLGSSAECTLGGVKLLATAPIVWELRTGVAPVTHEFPFHVSDLPRVLDLQGAPTELHIVAGTDDALGLMIRGLWVLGVYPGSNEDIRMVRVADWRWRLPYLHIIRRYNMRRRVGVHRPDSPNAEIITPVVEEISFWNWSLNEGSRWTPEDIFDDIHDQISGSLFVGRGGHPRPLLVNNLPDSITDMPVENLEIDDSADSALNRILDFFPGASMFVDWHGRLVLFSMADGTEGELVGSTPPWPIYNRGLIEHVDRAAIRPSAVNVMFTIECEFRCDFIEDSGEDSPFTVTPTTPALREGARLMENVLSLPDFSLDLTYGTPPVTEKVHQGTYVEIGDVLSSWHNAPGDAKFPPAGGRAVSLDDLRKSMLPFVDLASALLPPNIANPSLHIARIGSLLENYRRTFRISERWMDRFLAIRPYRVATIDPATGTRAPATAYCDYSYLKNQPVIMDNLGLPEGQRSHYAVNVTGYPRPPAAQMDLRFPQILSLTEDSTIPGKVSIVDQDQGIIQVDFVTGPLKYYSQVLPGTIDDGNNPKGIVNWNWVRREPLFFNAKMSGGKLPELEPTWQLAVIFTAVPSSPNNSNQLFTIEIDQDNQDLQDLLPPGLNPAVRRAAGLGPSMDVRVPAGVETARIMWRDDLSDLIMRDVFGYQSETVVRSPINTPLSTLVVNLKQIPQAGRPRTFVAFNELEAIALAEAARVYNDFANKYEGNSEYAFGLDRTPLTIQGNMESLVLTVSPDGEVTVAVSLPTNRPRLSMYSFLDSGTRSFLMRLVPNPNQAH